MIIVLQVSLGSLEPTNRPQALLVQEVNRELLEGLEPRDLKEPKEKRDKMQLRSQG